MAMQSVGKEGGTTDGQPAAWPLRLYGVWARPELRLWRKNFFLTDFCAFLQLLSFVFLFFFFFDPKNNLKVIFGV